MSGKRPRHDDEQARSDGNNPLVRKQKKGRIRESVAVEAKEKLLSLMASLLPKLAGMESEDFDIYYAMIQLENEVRKLLEQLRPEHCACKIRCCANQMDNSTSRSLQLKFINKLTLPSFTMENVKGEDSSVPSIALLDAQTRQIVKSGPESSLDFEMVLLQGHFKGNDDGNWTSIQFSNHIVRERKGKRPLLIGDVSLTLNEGIAVAHELKITDNSGWMRSRTFRLAARVGDGYFEGMRIKEAITEPFVVKENRGKQYMKKHPPSLNDEVWRLEKIGKELSKRLSSENVNTVKDFLSMLHADAPRLRNILGPGMNDERWEVIKNHAEECDPGSEMCVYYSKDEPVKGVVFNIVGTVIGFHLKGQFNPINSLPEIQKVEMQKMIEIACENWGEVVPYVDGAPILGSSSNMAVDSFPCGSTRPENPTNTCSSSQHSGGPSLHQGQFILPINDLSEIQKVDWGVVSYIDGDILGSSSNVAVDSFPCGSMRLENPTNICSSSQHSGGLPLHQLNVFSPPVMASSEYNNLSHIEGMEFVYDSDPPTDFDATFWPELESQADHVNTTSSFFNMSVQPVAANDKAHPTWKTLITVLKFSILIVEDPDA